MIEGKLLSVGGMKLYYEINAREPFIIYLHGVLTNHTAFSHQRAHFHDLGCGSLSTDQRGNGKSTHLPDSSMYSLENFTDDLEQIVEREGIEAATIVGHSAGSLVAQNYASRHPEQVEALVLIGASYNFVKSFERTSLRKRFLQFIPPLANLFFRSYNRAAGLVYSDREDCYLDFSQSKFKSISDLGFLFEINGRCSPEYVRAMEALGEAMMSWSTESVTGSIQAPTLLIHGDSDQLVPQETAYELHEMIPNSITPVIIPNSRHGIPFQAPGPVNNAMHEFLREIYPDSLR